MQETYDTGNCSLEIVEVYFTIRDRDGGKEPNEIIFQRPRDGC
jgi:hypothetical protein